MKVRLTANSIRLRLGPADVATLADAGTIVSSTPFGPAAALTVTLSTAPDGPPVAVLDGSLVRLTVPTAAVRRWAATAAEVSIRADHDVGGGRVLSVLVEKDFECLHGEQEGDAFPNPASDAPVPSPGTPGEG